MIIFEGVVSFSNGTPAESFTVNVFEKIYQGNNLLASSTTGADGRYRVVLESAMNTLVFFLELTNAGKQSILVTELLFQVPATNIKDFVVSGAVAKPPSDYDRYRKVIGPVHKITAADISYLAGKAGLDRHTMEVAVQAGEFEEQTGLPGQLYFAWVLQGLPPTLSALALWDTVTLQTALVNAVDKQIVHVTPEEIDQYLQQWTGFIVSEAMTEKEDGVSLSEVLSLVITDLAMQKKILAAYLNWRGPIDSFWETLADNKADVQLVLGLSALTGNVLAVTGLLYKEVKDQSDPFKHLAGWTKEQWMQLIAGVPEQHFEPAVTHINKNGQPVLEAYVDAIMTSLYKTYPTEGFFRTLANSKPRSLHTRGLEAFFKKNPHFDFTASSTLTLEKESFDLSDVDKSNVISQLQQVQRLFVYTKDVHTIDTLISDGLDSARAIAQKDRTAFIDAYEPLFGSVQEAEAVYDKAHGMHLHALMLWSKYQANLNFPTAVVPDQVTRTLEPGGDSTLVSMFGSLDGGEYDHCSSVFGAAAYFTDTLHFLKDRASELYEEIKRRRPDLFTILLECKNAETPLPYIDLVNELLENFVLTHKTPPSPVPPPYQTTWTAMELSASPEHLNYHAYEELKQEVYPALLPFNFPLEEVRIYLHHLQMPRHALMTLFYPGPSETQAFPDYAVCIERLFLSQEEAKIITGEMMGNGGANSGPWNFYGFDKPQGFKPVVDPLDSFKRINTGTWVQVLSGRVDVFLQQTGLLYKEMLAMLLCEHINPVTDGHPKIQIVAKETDADGNPMPPATNLLHLLELKGLDDDSLQKLHRFIRLQRKINRGIYDIDKLITAFGLTHNVGGWKELLKNIAQVQVLLNLCNISLDELLSFWADIGTKSYTDYSKNGYPQITSLYEKLFRDKTVAFPSDIDTVINEDNVSTITSALQISYKEFSLLTAHLGLGSDWTLRNISLLYRHVLLARVLKVGIEDFIKLKILVALEPFKTPANTYAFLQQVNLITASGFNFNEVHYLLNHDTIQTEIRPADQAISVFLSELRAALRASRNSLPDGAPTNENEQKRIIVQKFSEKLRITFRAASLLLIDYKSTSAARPLVERFWSADLSSDFLKTYYTANQEEYQPLFTRKKTNIEKEVVVPQLFEAYSLLDKIATVINRFGLKEAELDQVLDKAALYGCLQLLELPVAAQDGGYLNGFIVLANLVRARDLLPTGEPAFFDILNSTNKTQWIQGIIDRTGWNLVNLEKLVGKAADAGPTGLFMVRFPEDFINGSLVLRVHACLTAFNTIGSQADIIMQVAGNTVTSTIAQTLKNAVKAKYDESKWMEVAKPLRDQLREMQRAALVSYIVNRADPARNERWGNVNELYEYLLIDVEMKPVVITSRMRQAICSIQLFIDRVLMNLEYPNGDHSRKPIPMTDDVVAEWKNWRRQYRIWEAGRKIFLYPENWLEPELRDDKSPFFSELETELKQNELNQDNVEIAFRNYLEKLDEVARLEVAGVFWHWEPRTVNPETGQFEEKIDVLHVFGRTIAYPYKYFHRSLQDNEWTPWWKMEVDIDSNHVFPVIFNRRLCVFWLFFTEQHEDRDKLDPANISTPDGYWKIQVAWSEYRNGKWGLKRLSKNYFESKRFPAEDQNPDGTPVPQHLARTIKQRMAAFREAVTLHYVESTGVGVGAQAFFLRTNNREGFREAGSKYESNIAMLFRDLYHDPEISASGYDNGSVTMEYGPGYISTREMKLENKTPDDTPVQLYYDDKTIALESTRGNYRLTVPWNTKESIVGDIIFGNNKGQNWAPTGHIYFYQDTKNTFHINASLELEIPSMRAAATSFRERARLIQSIWKKPVIAAPVEEGELFTGKGLASIFAARLTTPAIAFRIFYHPNVKKFIRSLNGFGIGNLLMRAQQFEIKDKLEFKAEYKPTPIVADNEKYPLPDSHIDFSYNGAYSVYNWELFFHMPMLIACRLTTDQRFEEARRWFHYIFDPTRKEDGGKERFWQFKPFYDEAKKKIVTLDDLLRNGGQLSTQLEKWARDPFQPHVIARLRVMAYMKNVVMKYLDNLVAWGDQLFRRDTIEDINQATNLFVLAAKILGPRPQQVPPRAKHRDLNFEEIEPSLDLFSNALVKIETFIAPSALPAGARRNPERVGEMFYFGIPPNEFLLKYWDTVSDRLFKIRHGMNIEGVARTLSLFESPIDPALLVRASAAGMDLNSILSDIKGSLPHYRFPFMFQKAMELVNDVKMLGSALLTALEKRDDTSLQLLRLEQEQKLLDSISQVKKKQIEDTEAMLAAAKTSHTAVLKKQSYYRSREYMNVYEKQHLTSIQAGMVLSVAQGHINTMAGVLSAIPNFKLGAPTSVGATFGGDNLSAVMSAISNYLGIMAAINTAQGVMASTLGAYNRRMDDWNFLGDMATVETEQSEKQVLSGEIRLAVAKNELQNHELQMEHTKAIQEFMLSRFTNKELYDWQVGQLSTLYFQTYQLAYDMAKRAERCYQFETGQFGQKSFIQFGYWDSLKKGLLSAEKLQYDLRRMDVAWSEESRRRLEMTKHVSLLLLDPKALLDLIQRGTCDFIIPEELFDIDYPGHYCRRLRSVSLTIPCVTGPYTTINCTLTLISSVIRIKKDSQADYASSNYANDSRFYIVNEKKAVSIATSHGQNDNGLFEFGFNNDQYLPFEGCGVFGQYRLELQPEKELRQFNYDTISDVVLHMQYTALDGDGLKAKANEHLKKIVRNTVTPDANRSGMLLWRMFSLRHDFPNEWHRFVNTPDGTPAALQFTTGKDRFPYFIQERAIVLNRISLTVDGADGHTFSILLNGQPVTPGIPLGAGNFSITKADGNGLDEEQLKNMYLLLDYKLN